jgi:hypothetical protein
MDFAPVGVLGELRLLVAGLARIGVASYTAKLCLGAFPADCAR